jgi:hypothetical protein
MATDDTRLLELAIESLESKRNSIDEELAELRARMRGASKRRGPGRPPKAASEKAGKRRRRRRMSAATRKALSERMKQRWAERKRAKR